MPLQTNAFIDRPFLTCSMSHNIKQLPDLDVVVVEKVLVAIKVRAAHREMNHVDVVDVGVMTTAVMVEAKDEATTPPEKGANSRAEVMTGVVWR